MRLAWTKETPGPRAVEPGQYQLLGYRLMKGDWMISTTGGRQRVEVTPGQSRPIALRERIQLNLRARRRRGKVMVMAGLSGGWDLGLTIYHEGKRIPLPYVIEDARGQRIGQGQMRYG